MKKIISQKEAINLSYKFKRENKKIVLVGGCFDILHIGHIKFLKKAKFQGDVLLVILESDKNVTKLKGKERPINSQKVRAEILSGLYYVDYVVLLSEIKTNKDYDKLIFSLSPDVIAITKGSKQAVYAKAQAKVINAKVVTVINRIKNKSTTKLAKLILEKFNE